MHVARWRWQAHPELASRNLDMQLDSRADWTGAESCTGLACAIRPWSTTLSRSLQASASSLRAEPLLAGIAAPWGRTTKSVILDADNGVKCLRRHPPALTLLFSKPAFFNDRVLPFWKIDACTATTEPRNLSSHFLHAALHALLFYSEVPCLHQSGGMGLLSLLAEPLPLSALTHACILRLRT